jgi:DNA mismatch repair protein MSH6
MQGRKAVNYAESDEDEDDVLGPIANNSRARATKRRRVSVDDDSDDEFGLDAATQAAMIEDGTFQKCISALQSYFPIKS